MEILELREIYSEDFDLEKNRNTARTRTLDLWFHSRPLDHLDTLRCITLDFMWHCLYNSGPNPS